MLYSDLAFPSPPPSRPLVYANMVATIDGRTVLGERGEDVVGLGSRADQEVMDVLERAADAIILGAASVRANPKSWNPHCPIRIAVSSTGDLPWDTAFLAEGRAFLACPRGKNPRVPDAVTVLEFGEARVDVVGLLAHLRQELEIERLHSLGGSSLNGELIAADALDELFLTIAPKVKLGFDIPTYAIGEPLPRNALKQFSLVEHHVVGDEVFLRYRREGL